MPRDGGPWMALDYGRARIGVAIADGLGITTRPVGFVPRSSDAAAARIIATLAKQEGAGGLVVGLPINADGTQGENVRWVEAFIAALRAVCPLPIETMDERYSSGEAEAALRAEGQWPATPGQIDAKAAAIILRRFLDGET